MKTTNSTSRLLLALATGSLFATAAQAQIEVVITGATAFRSIVQDRIPNYLLTGVTTIRATNAGVEVITYTGNLANVSPSLNGQPAIIRTSFTGSGKGLSDVYTGTPVQCALATGTLVAKTPDIAFSDAYPASVTPPLKTTDFDTVTNVGVVPFVFVAHNTTGITNITQDQVELLMTASGVMPASFLGGANGNPVYLVGRDNESGTRIVTFKCVAFTGEPIQWAKVGGVWVTTNGFASSSIVRSVTAANADAIGYMTASDALAIVGSARTLTYNGVAYNTANVLNGSYSIWGYEIAAARVGIGANQKTVFRALAAAIADPTYQTTNPNYVGKYEVISQMQVERSGDGAVITSKNW
jgi:hypothetical protein